MLLHMEFPERKKELEIALQTLVEAVDGKN